jgi:hypothetical protein
LDGHFTASRNGLGYVRVNVLSNVDVLGLGKIERGDTLQKPRQLTALVTVNVENATE